MSTVNCSNNNNGRVKYKLIPWCNAYCVGTDGSVWTRRLKGGGIVRKLLDRWKKMKPYGKDNHHLGIDLRIDNQSKWFAVHRLIWITFNGPIPRHLETNHKDGDKHNNALSNLEIITHAGNIKHAYDNGLIPPRDGAANSNARLTEDDVRLIRQLCKDEESYRKQSIYYVDSRRKYRRGFVIALAKKFNVNPVTIKDVANRKTWKNLA